MGPEALGGFLAGATVSGVLMGIFQNNAGGAWDNAKKSFEKGVEINGEMFYKKSEPHKASVTGDTVGDPFKDTSGPSMNILIKLMSIVSLVIAPYISVGNAESNEMNCHAQTEMCVGMDSVDMGNCDLAKCMSMTPEACAAYCDSMKCTPEQKAACVKMMEAHKGIDMSECSGSSEACKDKANCKDKASCSGKTEACKSTCEKK